MVHREADTFISGGYFLTRAIARPAGMGEGLLPDTLITASGCLCPHIPDFSLLSWATSGQEGKMIRIVSEFRLPLGALDMLVDWVTQEYEREVGHPDIFYHLATAQEVARNYFPNRPDILVCGLGLHRSLAGGFLRQTRPPGYGTGLKPQEPLGAWKAIQAGQEIAGGGEALGFELLCYDHSSNTLGCSWLCNGLERDFHELFGIRPNEYGLIGALDEAARCAQAIHQGELDGQPEPGLWLPWLITRYPVENLI